MSNGPTQERILGRASTGLVMVVGNAERCAARRLVKRGILTRQRFGGPGLGYITVYRIAA